MDRDVPAMGYPSIRIFLSPPDVTSEEKRCLDDAFASNFIAPVGPALRAFELALSEHLGQGVEAVALSSGTAALHLAFVSLGLGPGDAAILPSTGFAATAFAVCYTGARPVFADVDSATWTLCPDRCEEAMALARRRGLRPRAIVPVDLYGQSARYTELQEICQREGTAIVQDAAEAVGGTFGEEPLGRQGDFGVFSFNGNKIITTGGGGALIARPNEAAHLRNLAAQAREPGSAYIHHSIGYNYRMPNLSAAIGLGQLRRLPTLLERRKRNRIVYQTRLGDLPGLTFNPLGEHGRANNWLTCLQLDPSVAPPPAVVEEALRWQGIEARPVWKPMHQQPVFQDALSTDCPVADELFLKGLCLPSGSNLSELELEEICRIVRRCWPS